MWLNVTVGSSVDIVASIVNLPLVQGNYPDCSHRCLGDNLNRLAYLRKPGKKLFEALSVGVRSISNAIDCRKSMSANGAMTKIVSPACRCFRTLREELTWFHTERISMKRLRDVAVAM